MKLTAKEHNYPLKTQQNLYASTWIQKRYLCTFVYTYVKK